MLYIAIVFFGTTAVCYGAYRLGRRSEIWSIALAPILMPIAWYALVYLTRIGNGEGAAAGVVVIDFAIWYVGGMCVLLALILLGTSVYVRRSGVATAVLLCVVATDFALGYRMVSDRNPTPKESGAPSQGAVEPHDSDLEGYAWALDNGIQAEAACVNGSPAFVDGCKRAVRRRNENAKPAVPGR